MSEASLYSLNSGSLRQWSKVNSKLSRRLTTSHARPFVGVFKSQFGQNFQETWAIPPNVDKNVHERPPDNPRRAFCGVLKLSTGLGAFRPEPCSTPRPSHARVLEGLNTFETGTYVCFHF